MSIACIIYVSDIITIILENWNFQNGIKMVQVMPAHEASSASEAKFIREWKSHDAS